MAIIKNDQIESFMKGGSSFFKLEDGQSARVRFLYNTINDIVYYAVHEFSGSNFATIECPRGSQDDPVDICKWCAQGNKVVGRVVIPVFNEDTQEVQYWKRSLKWCEDSLKPILMKFTPGMPISGQPCEISRKGKKMQDTTYTIMPVVGVANDGRTKETFGEIKDPVEMQIIKPADFEFDPNANKDSNNPPQATRRTVDVF